MLFECSVRFGRSKWLLAIALCLSGLVSAADAPEDAVKAAYKSLETAARNGDGQLWLNLQSKSRLGEMPEEARQRMLQGGFRDQSVQYEPLAVRVKKDDAVLIGRFHRLSDPYTYHTVRFTFEDGQWKIAAESMSNTRIDQNSLWALLPPDDGAFERAHSPWSRIPYAGVNTQAFQPAQLPWKMQATVDESFLNVRFESGSALPDPGSEIHKTGNAPMVDPGVPPGPPIMVVQLGGPGQAQKAFELKAEAQVETRSTFDSNGKANSYRYFVAYSLWVTQPTRGVQIGNTIFNSSLPSPFGGPITVQDRFLDIKIPLKALGWFGPPPTVVQIREFNSVPQILPHQVSQFSQ
jgi:hypothetical protein